MPKLATGTYVQEHNTFGSCARACSELGECSGHVSINAGLLIQSFCLDLFWMCTTGVGDSVQPMVIITTFALKMSVCVHEYQASSYMDSH